jgi:hypothetical protein
MRIGYRKGELEGEWALFARIAGPFVNEVPPKDKEDFFHDLLVEMAKVKKKYEVKGKPLTEASLMKVASYELKGYWDKRRFRLFGLNCTHCTIEQRRECRITREPSQCPKRKAHQVLSLNEFIRGGDGDKPTELWELIPDDKKIDLDAKLDARRELQSLPKQLVQLGFKRYSGYRLTRGEKGCLGISLKRRGRILVILKSHPKGITRREIAAPLQVPVREVDWLLTPLIRRGLVFAVRRENTRGRPLSPLLFIIGAEIPEEKMVKTERDERIRQAYFTEGCSIKQIAREFHHCKRTVRKAIYLNNALEPGEPGSANQQQSRLRAPAKGLALPKTNRGET